MHSFPSFPPGMSLAETWGFWDPELLSCISSSTLPPFMSEQTHPSPAVSCSGFFIAHRYGTVGQHHQPACFHVLGKGWVMVYLGTGTSSCIALPGFHFQADPVDLLTQPYPRLVGGYLESNSSRTRWHVGPGGQPWQAG